MKIRTAIFGMIAMLFAGVAFGFLVAVSFGSHFVSTGSLSAEVADANIFINTLKLVRKGDTEKSIEIMESRLDGSVIQIRAFLRSSTDLQANTYARDALQAAQQYRRQFPRTTSDSAVDKAVAQSLTPAD